MIIEGVIACLDAFVPGKESENIDQLYQCLGPLATLAPAARFPAVPAMLRVIERSPSAELGAPGPLVHELEAIPGYQEQLVNSLQRQPANLTVWMANRILNSQLVPEVRARWLALLTEVLRHPNTSEDTKKTAAEFLEYQSS